MFASGKLTLTSKKPCEQVVPRKPVKECYCRFEVNKTTRARSSRTRHKSVSSCCHCRGEIELGSIRETDDKAASILPISCETFRRVQEIDYMPKSQFLRNVQSKIYELRTADQSEDCLRSCPRSSNYHRFMTSAQMQNTLTNKKTALPDERKLVDDRQESPTSLTVTANSLASEQSESDDVAYASSKGTQGTQVSSRKLSKSTLRKTIGSKRQVPESSERSTKSPTRGKRTVWLHKRGCPCCRKNELKTAKLGGDKRAERHTDLPEYRERRERCFRHDDSRAFEDFMDREMENLRKFREQNYFETHGSSHTLTSSKSSGSLQQYMLNERLFPEPVDRIDKQDLVVTVPSSATTQRKRIHYFPRYVVRQEKNACNARSKRCQSCPLTGHAIDLGVLKIRPPLNSLALKYQKRAL